MNYYCNTIVTFLEQVVFFAFAFLHQFQFQENIVVKLNCDMGPLKSQTLYNIYNILVE